MMIDLNLFNWKDGDEDEVRISSWARSRWELVFQDGFWGVRDRVTRELVLPCRYDNAFFYAPDALVVCASGKWGAVEPARGGLTQERLHWIAECEYDTFEIRG